MEGNMINIEVYNGIHRLVTELLAAKGKKPDRVSLARDVKVWLGFILNRREN